MYFWVGTNTSGPTCQSNPSIGISPRGWVLLYPKFNSDRKVRDRMLVCLTENTFLVELVPIASARSKLVCSESS